jgi:outer membrane receptor protein involved in Fe transport
MLLPCHAAADDILGQSDLGRMSFEDLMQVKVAVPGALTSLTGAETPASVTLITSEDIRCTPARNIYDLIEVYVPGAIWLNYEVGPQLGVRGLVSNHNTKYLLLVNGRTMNNVGHFGAMSELEQWDLGDIQQIEIVRGPGSVTYGPGAIAGVISITTHTAVSSPGLKVGFGLISQYESKNMSLSYGRDFEKFGLYAYASMTRTSGYAAHHFLGTNNQEAGYIGETIDLDKQPLDYFSDFDDQPQAKLLTRLDFGDHWQFWARYTQQGSTWRGNELKTDFFGSTINLHGLQSRQFATTLRYEDQIRENVVFHSLASYSTSDALRRKDNPNDPDPDHILNKQAHFCETSMFVTSTVNWQANDRAEIALGAELCRNHFGAPWGKSEDDMKLGDNGIIVSDAGSNAIRDGNVGNADRDGTAIFVGDGWSTNSSALFSEVNLELQPGYKLLLSGRLDKNRFTNWLISPRVVLIANVGEGHYLKFIGQRSVRMNTASQLFTESHKGLETNTETLQGFELIYTRLVSDRLQFSITGFRNSIDIIAWDSDDNVTEPLGQLELYGIELEFGHHWASGELGLNYSVSSQLDWTLVAGETKSGVSYSDYNQPIGDGLQTGQGNDLGNWPNHTLKMFGRLSLTERIVLHLNTRIVFDYQGSKDGLTGLSSAVAGTSDELAVANALQQVEAVGAFDTDYRTNASVVYVSPYNLNAGLYVQNLIKSNNYRYAYDNGNKRPSPKGVRFTEEPTTWGVKIGYGF